MSEVEIFIGFVVLTIFFLTALGVRIDSKKLDLTPLDGYK